MIVDRFSAMGDDDTDRVVVVVVGGAVAAPVVVLFGVNRLSKNEAKNSEINFTYKFCCLLPLKCLIVKQKVYEIENKQMNKQKTPFYESVCLCLFIERNR